MAPWTNIGLELSVVLFRDAPSGDIGIEIALPRLIGGDLLDVDLRVRLSGMIGLSDQRGVEARGQKAVPGELAPERGIVHARHDLEGRLHTVAAIPGEQRLDLAFVARPQPDDPPEGRQEQRH